MAIANGSKAFQNCSHFHKKNELNICAQFKLEGEGLLESVISNKSQDVIFVFQIT